MHSHPKEVQGLHDRLTLLGYPLYSHHFDWQMIIFPLSHPLISNAIFCSLQIYLFPAGQRQSALCCRFIFIPTCYNAWHWGSETILFTTSPAAQIIMSLCGSALSISIHLFKYIPKPAGCTKEIQLCLQQKCCSTSPRRSIYCCEQFTAFKCHQHARKWKITYTTDSSAFSSC